MLAPSTTCGSSRSPLKEPPSQYQSTTWWKCAKAGFIAGSASSGPPNSKVGWRFWSVLDEPVIPPARTAHSLGLEHHPPPLKSERGHVRADAKSRQRTDAPSTLYPPSVSARQARGGEGSRCRVVVVVVVVVVGTAVGKIGWGGAGRNGCLQ